MDRKYIDDHHVVARYLADQLPEPERQAFEAYYLEHPEIVQELEAAARFKTGLMQLRDAGQLDALTRSPPLLQRPQVRVAAVLALMAIALLLLFQMQSGPVMMAAAPASLVGEAGAPLPRGRTYALVRTRAAAYDEQIELPSAPQTLELRALPETAANPPRYEATLSRIADDQTLHELGTVGGLTPAPDGFVAVYVNSGELTRGRYVLTIAAENAGSSTAVSTFRVRVR